MQKKKAFTLIELLVVISIIALLIAILMPALNKAREQATGAVCLANQKNMMLAWIMYADDNDDAIVSGVVPENTEDNVWREPPQDDDGNYRGALGDNPTLHERHNGIRAGSLYKYTKTVDVYHCPGDKRWTKGSVYGNGPDYQMYASYSLPAGMGPGGPSAEHWLKKTSEIKTPSSKYTFLEEAYDGSCAAFACYTWSFIYSQDINDPANYSWWDMLSSWHNKKTTMGFADGHAEMHGWVDDRTVTFFLDRRSGDRLQADNPDIRYMIRHHPKN